MIVNYLPVLMYLYVTAIMDFKDQTVQSVRNSSLVIIVRDVRQTILDTTLHALNSASMDFRQKQVTWPAHKILVLNALAGVKLFKIIPEFRILGLTFHRKSASKC